MKATTTRAVMLLVIGATLAGNVIDVLAGPDTRPGASVSLANEIAGVLMIPEGRENPLPAIHQAVQDFDADQLGPLVDTLSRSDFTSVRNAVLAHTSVLKEYSAVQLGYDPSWLYGSYRARQHVRDLLWAKAKALAETDAVRGRDYARAAILFYAMDDFPVGAYGLRRFIQDKAGLKVAAISSTQASAILKIIEARSTGSSNRDASRAIDRLFNHPNADEFTHAIDALNHWRQEKLDVFGDYEFAKAAGQLANHAAEASDPVIQSMVKAALTQWKAGTAGNFRRWLDEVTAAPTEPARLLNLTIWKDGRWVDTDTDGNPL